MKVVDRVDLYTISVNLGVFLILLLVPLEIPEWD